MKTEGVVKYYEGVAVEAGQEVSAEAARKLANYAKAFFRTSGQLDRVEVHTDGQLTRVDYPAERGGGDDIQAAHARMYSGTGFSIRRKLSSPQGFSWEEVESHAASGGREGSTLVLQRKGGQGLMEVELDRNRKVQRVTKYCWEGEDELRYVFEYNAGGRLVSVYDLTHGDQVRIEDLRSTLPEPGFFERGLTLPSALSHTAIPL